MRLMPRAAPSVSDSSTARVNDLSHFTRVSQVDVPLAQPTRQRLQFQVGNPNQIVRLQCAEVDDVVDAAEKFGAEAFSQGFIPIAAFTGILPLRWNSEKPWLLG